jgi:L-asparaginase/Glu-tRNA(Gln) amidotransferase subunit D
VKESEANAYSASWAAKEVLIKQDQMCQHTNTVAKQIEEFKQTTSKQVEEFKQTAAKQIGEVKQTVSKRQAKKGKSRKVSKTPVKQGKRTNKPERVPDPTAKKIVILGVKPGMNNDAVAALINAQVKLKAVV